MATVFREKIGNDLNVDGMWGKGVVNSSAPTTILDHIGGTWRCQRLAREPDMDFAYRLSVHLHAVQIAVTEDRRWVLQIEKEANRESIEDE